MLPYLLCAVTRARMAPERYNGVRPLSIYKSLLECDHAHFTHSQLTEESE